MRLWKDSDWEIYRREVEDKFRAKGCSVPEAKRRAGIFVGLKRLEVASMKKQESARRSSTSSEPGPEQSLLPGMEIPYAGG